MTCDLCLVNPTLHGLSRCSNCCELEGLIQANPKLAQRVLDWCEMERLVKVRPESVRQILRELRQ
jgi:hypothetical protein